MLCVQDMNEVLMLDMESSGGYAGASPQAGARFAFADRSGSALPIESLDAAAQIAEVTSAYSSVSSKWGHLPASSRTITRHALHCNRCA